MRERERERTTNMYTCILPFEARRVCDFTQGHVCHVTTNRTISRPLVLRWSPADQSASLRAAQVRA